MESINCRLRAMRDVFEWAAAKDLTVRELRPAWSRWLDELIQRSNGFSDIPSLPAWHDGGAECRANNSNN